MDARTTQFSVAEAKARFSELLARAEAGEEIVIRRHGKAVAKLVRPTSEMTVNERLQAWNEWFVYRDTHGIALGLDLTIKDLINEGRRY